MGEHGGTWEKQPDGEFAWFFEAEFRIEPCQGTKMHPGWLWTADIGGGFSINFGATPWEALTCALYYAVRTYEEGMRD
jgi:hypothetical protein